MLCNRSGSKRWRQNHPRGLPIGNLTSQIWATWYLNPFDHFVERELACKGYVRCVDDYLLFSNNKAELLEWRNLIVKRLTEFRLTLYEAKTQARPVSEGIPILGFTIFPSHRRLKRRKGIAFQREYRNYCAAMQKQKFHVQKSLPPFIAG